MKKVLKPLPAPPSAYVYWVRAGVMNQPQLMLTDLGEEHLRQHYADTKNRELATLYGISPCTIYKLSRQRGLAKSQKFMEEVIYAQGKRNMRVANMLNNWPPKGYVIPNSEKHQFKKGHKSLREQLGEERYEAMAQRRKAKRARTVRMERFRILSGEPQRTKLKLGSEPYGRKRKDARQRLRLHGYIPEHEGRGVLLYLYSEQTQRSALIEQRYARLGFSFAPLKSDNEQPITHNNEDETSEKDG